MQAIDFHALSRSVQERFAASVAAAVDPAPIMQARVRSHAVAAWTATSVIAALALVGFAARGFGDASSRAAFHGPGMLAVYVTLVAIVALGIVRVLLLRAEAACLPYPRGVYVFPMNVVDARDSNIRVFMLTELKKAEGPDDHDAIQLDVEDEHFVFPHESREAAEQALVRVREAWERGRTMKDTSDPRISLTFTLDPLQRPRVSAPLGPKGDLARRLPSWTRHAWLLSPLAGIVLGPPLRTARNLASDERMFAHVTAQNDVSGYQAYLSHGEGRHRAEITRTLLPRAELKIAAAQGTVEAIDTFIASHPGTAIDEEMFAARRVALLADLETAKKAGTLDAIQAFAKRHPDHHLEPEVRDAVHALFAPALEAFHNRQPPADPTVRAFLERLFAYSEGKAQAGSTDTKVQIRFRRRPSSTMWKGDKYIGDHPWFIGEVAYPSRYFDANHEMARETLLADTIGKALGEGFGPTVFTFEQGPRIADDVETLPTVTVPTVFITHGEEWPRTFAGNITKPRGIWIDVTFDIDATFVIPGDQAPLAYHHEQRIPVDKKMIEAEEKVAQPPPTPFEERLYGAMSKTAFDEFATKYLATFVAPKAK
jgi:hypothetical protein